MRRILWLIVPVLVVGVLAIAALATRGPASATAFTLKPGDCFDVPGDTQIGDVATLDCSVAHDAEVFDAEPLTVDAPASSPAPYPGSSPIATWVEDHCGPAQVTDYAGAGASASLAVGYFFPDANAWTRGERQVTCYLHTRDGSKLTAPVRTGTASASPS